MSNNSIIVEAFIYNEKEKTSVLLHPEVENIAIDLYLKSREPGHDIGPYIVRQSFLLLSADSHFNEAANFGLSLIPKDAKPEYKEKEGHQSFGALGRSVYPLFSSINSFLSVTHASMNYSIALICIVCKAKDWRWSINWANSKGKSELLKYAGKDITNHIAQSWEWASELKDYRDLMEHFNPFYTQPVITFTSSNGINYDSFKCLLPNKPESRRTTGDKQEWGQDAMSYCYKTRNKVLAFNKELINLLISRLELKKEI